MSDTTQQYDGRLYTEVEVGRLIAEARQEYIDSTNPIQEVINNLTQETPCLADQPL